MRRLEKKYFDWMCKRIDNPDDHHSYKKLLGYLYEIEFIYGIDLDENRAIDGIDFRYRYEYETGNVGICELLSGKPCSVLEVMVALANRMEESIMSDPNIDDRTSVWFWDMIRSLGLIDMHDRRFDERYIDKVVDAFLYRKHSANGEGGLFTVYDCEYDLREIEIWDQMSLYLREVIKMDKENV